MSSADSYLRRLRSKTPTDRLEAARYFAENAKPSDEKALREAAAQESVAWVRNALARAIDRLSPEPEKLLPRSLADRDDLPEGFASQVHAEALETTTAQLIHEIEPLVGSLRLSAELEVENYDASSTKENIDRLDEFLAALSRLRRAASAPRLDEFSLDELVEEIIQTVDLPAGLKIQKAGPQHCIVVGDRTLVQMSVVNGMRNAIEATVATAADLNELPIAVTWGQTDRDCWVSIVDNGIGFKGNLARAFDIGTTTKDGHMGMGLAIANQSIASMSGQLLLVPNERGVRFELRWPQSKET